MEKQQASRAAANTAESLRRSILDSAYKGQEQAKLAQLELGRQGEQLKSSLSQAKVAALQTVVTTKAVDDLISKAKASKLRKIFRCCLDTCCCNRCYTSTGGGGRGGAESSRGAELELRATASPTQSDNDGSDNEDNETLVRLESLKSAMSGSGHAATTWKRTLAPPPGVLGGGTEIWHRQMDASLTQLQHVAEDMGQSLDEQIKLAQMLTIYLNYGVDQVLGANERLAAEKGLF